MAHGYIGGARAQQYPAAAGACVAGGTAAAPPDNRRRPDFINSFKLIASQCAGMPGRPAAPAIAQF
jgi:hypothetical protein